MAPWLRASSSTDCPTTKFAALSINPDVIPAKNFIVGNSSKGNQVQDIAELAMLGSSYSVGQLCYDTTLLYQTKISAKLDGPNQHESLSGATTFPIRL